MPSSYTSSLRLTLPVQGELAGSWGNTVNSGITQLLDTAVAGTAAITMTAANYTLTNNNGATDEARSMFLVLGGTPGASYQVICPAVSKLYFVTNNTGFAQTVKTATGSGISVPNGARMTLRCDGTDVVEALNAFGSLTINTGKVLLPNTQSYAIKTSAGVSCDVVTLTSGNVLQLGGGGATDSVQFWNQGLERMRLDSSGNLGIGTSSPATTLHVQSATGQARIQNTTSGTALIGFRNSTTTDVPWVGTGGDDLRFTTVSTERMRLDSSGNLGVGTSSPGAKLHVKVGTDQNLLTTTVSSKVTNLATNDAGSAYVDWQQYANQFLWFTASTERMRLDASGGLTLSSAFPSLKVGSSAVSTADCSVEVGVGRTGSGNAYIDLVGDTTWTDYGLRIIRNNGGANTASSINHKGTGALQLTCENAGDISFATNATERARITSGGDLLVGTTSNPNNYKTHIVTSAASIALGIFANNATTPSGINVYYGAAAPNNGNANTSYLYCNDTSTVRIQLSSNGGIHNYSGNNVNLSDRREKTNFAPAKSYLDTICAIPVQTFNYIDQNIEEDPGLTLGVVAQDVQAVAPELVMESNWGTADEPKQRLSIYQTDLQYALMKCIQEQQVLITDLRARVAALEAA